MFQKIKLFLFENTSLYQTIAKNTLWLLGGQFVGRLVRAGLVIYAARVLGPASWGAFSYALSFSAFLAIFSDSGINALITKEASREPELRKKYFATGFFIKLVILLLVIGGVLFASPYLSRIPEAVSLIPIIVFVFAFDSLRDLGSSFARALEKMEIESVVNILTNFFIVALGFIFLLTNLSSRSLAIAYALGSGLGMAVILIYLKDYFGNIFGNFTKNLVKPILTKTWVFGLVGIMGATMINTDIIMLGWLRNAAEVGFYSAAQKPIQLLYVLPAFLASSVFPALARFGKSDKEKFKKLFRQFVKITLLAALPLALGGLVFARPIIEILYGKEYLTSVKTLQILSPTLLFVFPAMIIGNALFALDKQRNLLAYVLLGIFGNIVFNFLLIPRFGIEGAALATLLNQSLLALYSFFIVKRWM